MNYRYVSPARQIFIIRKADKNFPLCFGSKSILSVPFKKITYKNNTPMEEVCNALIGYAYATQCKRIISNIQPPSDEPIFIENVSVGYLKAMSDTLNMPCIVNLSYVLSEDTSSSEVFYYQPPNYKFDSESHQ